MKGVIVQVGDPKSIVLLNNGKIRAITSPPNCQVGMVVTVKLNSHLRIILFSLGALVLLSLGIFIGARLFGSPPLPGDPAPASSPAEDQGQRGPMRGPMRRMMGR